MKSKLDLLKRKIMSPLHSSTLSIHLFLLIIFIYALVCFTKPEKNWIPSLVGDDFIIFYSILKKERKKERNN